MKQFENISNRSSSQNGKEMKKLSLKYLVKHDVFFKRQTRKKYIISCFFSKNKYKNKYVLHSDYSQHSRHKDPAWKRVISVS